LPLRYQQQDSQQTLTDALDEYYAANDGIIVRPADLAPESAELFRSHDMCHVIFGLDTSMPDEVLADTRTMLSCDVGLRRYGAYLTGDPQAKAIFKQAGYLRTAWITLQAMPRVVHAAIEAMRMKKPWPWVPPQGYAARSLDDLRREYGIRVM
jgi:hypothetical protein